MYPEINKQFLGQPFFHCCARRSPQYSETEFKEYVDMARLVIRKTKSAKSANLSLYDILEDNKGMIIKDINQYFIEWNELKKYIFKDLESKESKGTPPIVGIGEVVEPLTT